MQNIEVKCFTVVRYAVNCYIVGNYDEVIIVDMGAVRDDFNMFEDAIGKRKLTKIVYTHGHIDHVCASDDARRHFKDAKHYIHEKDKIMFSNARENLSAYFGVPKTFKSPDGTFIDGDKFNVGDIEFTVIHTPGHSLGSVCYYTEGYLFCGDTLFTDGVGRTDFPHGNEDELYSSLNKKIFTLPDDTLYFPGHGNYGCVLGERKPF